MTHSSIITLTTDFGTGSPYLAAMKGVILSINPEARLVDLSHDVPPQDVLHGAFFLAETIPFFPTDTIHVAVVDPGVGTNRRLLYAECAGQRLLLPDNGLVTFLFDAFSPSHVRALTEPQCWRKTVSPTFHGRDILAPVAAHLSLGIETIRLGPPVSDWLSLELPQPRDETERISGEVIFVDRFGNLITNIPAAMMPPASAKITLKGHVIPRLVRTYGDANPGEAVALISSGGRLEIAVVQGNAAAHFGVDRGAAVRVWRSEMLAGGTGATRATSCHPESRP